MATTVVPTTHITGFKVGATDVRFGILWDAAAFLMTDWQRPSNTVDLTGANLTVTQLLGFGPRRVNYRLFFESITDYQTCEALVQQTGTLTVVSAGHTVTIAATATALSKDGRRYDTIASATLLSLTSAGVAPDGTVEADAIFQVST